MDSIMTEKSYADAAMSGIVCNITLEATVLYAGQSADYGDQAIKQGVVSGYDWHD